VFQEVENAYRNFLLRWIEAPLTIPEDSKPLLSPISQGLFDTMRISVLKRVDELLFSSPKPRFETKTISKINDLSIEKNEDITEITDRAANEDKMDKKIKLPQHLQLDSVSPATRLLEKRRAMYEV
jgi:hypothetical protein